jgi:acyl-CoA thioesterase I
LHKSLASFVEKLRAGAPVKVVMFGDSITFGSQIDPAYDHDIVFHRQWHDWLQQEFPVARIEILNKGIPGNKIADAQARVEKDVMSESPDLVVIEFGINDCWNGPSGAEAYENSLRELTQIIKSQTHAPIILLTPNMMNHAVTPEALKMAWFAETSAKAQTSGWMDEYMDRMRRVGAELDVPVADGYLKFQEQRAAGVDTDKLLANGANHPNKEAHSLLAQALIQLFAQTAESGT